MKRKNTFKIEASDSKLLDLLSSNNHVRIENSFDKIEVFDYEGNSCGLCYYYYAVIEYNQILIIESKVDNIDFIFDFKLFVKRVCNILQISQFEAICIFGLHKHTICQYSLTEQVLKTLLPIKTSNKLKQIINNLSKDKSFYRDNAISYLQEVHKLNSRELRIK